MIKSFRSFITEAVISPSKEPNTLSAWHGGNLDHGPSDDLTQKKGRFEFAPGLYLTTSYQVVQKYKKGSRKLYLVTIEKGTDIDDVRIPIEDVMRFTNQFVIKAKRRDVMDAVERRKQSGEMDAGIFLNILINNEAIKPTNTNILKNFLVLQGADYSIVDNAFGWGERMVIVFNNKIIKKIQVINPKDKIEVYDLPTEWS